MKKEILYIGLDVHAENIAAALASVVLSVVSVRSARRVCHHQICLTHLRLLAPPSPSESSATTPITPRRSATSTSNPREACVEAVEKAARTKAKPPQIGSQPQRGPLATRSRKGYWRLSANSIVQRALNRWLKETGSA